jgi:hypothetical protein
MKLILPFSLILLLASCSLAPKPRISRNWKKDSFKLAKSFGKSYGALFPEYVANHGFPRLNSKTTSFSKDLDNQTYSHAYRWKNKLSNFIEIEKNPDLLTDARILLDFQNMEMEKIELDRELGVIPFLPVSEHVVENLRSLIRKESTQLQMNAGMARFRAYVRGEQNKLPLVDGFTSHMLFRMKALADNRMRGVWPEKSEIENYLKHSGEFFKDLHAILSLWKGDEWKRDFEELKLQEANYREFLKRKVLPYSRVKTGTHPKLYAYQLKQSGILKTPSELIAIGEADYESTYKIFKELAKKVAQKNNLSDSKPQSVIKFLKSRKFTTENEILASYVKETDNLMSIVREKGILSLQRKPDFEIRFARKSEMSSMASPHFISEPQNPDNNVRAQFVIPLLSGEGGTDDYIYREAIVTLAAHEAIPGHAIQFHIMKERGTTLIRSWLAENSANVEGWALYAESLIAPHVDEEQKFVFIQRLLWRIARTFLDPQLNLGKIKRDRVMEVYVNELGFSESFAETEFRRYNFIMPGQAPSYYYGLRSLLETRKQVKEKLKENFSDKCFNDAVLDLGLMPLTEINSRLVKDLNCGV